MVNSAGMEFRTRRSLQFHFFNSKPAHENSFCSCFHRSMVVGMSTRCQHRMTLERLWQQKKNLPTNSSAFCFNIICWWQNRKRRKQLFLCIFSYTVYSLLTLSVHAREGYSNHFVCQSVSLSLCHSVCVSLFYFGERAIFRVETYISAF